MHEPSAAGRRALRVRYYPRRMDRAAAAGPATPGQALHLPRDPALAASAASTAAGVELAATPAAAPQASVRAPRGRFRTWWDGLFRR